MIHATRLIGAQQTYFMHLSSLYVSLAQSVSLPNSASNWSVLLSLWHFLVIITCFCMLSGVFDQFP